MASRTSPNNRLQDFFFEFPQDSVKHILVSWDHQLTRHKPNTSFHLLIVVVDERRSAADSEPGTLAESGIAAADKKVVDWRNIGVWASGRIPVVVGLCRLIHQKKSTNVNFFKLNVR